MAKIIRDLNVLPPTEAEIEKLVKAEFIYFLLERWKISSGEFQTQPYSFANRPYLYEYAKDTFPFKVCLKAAQAGVSEIEIAEAIWTAIARKMNSLYTFPAGEQMQDFVDARPRKAILDNEYLYKYKTGSLNLKKFSLNNNQIYFRGVQKRQQVISVDASALFADECDLYEEGILNTLNKRLGASQNPVKRYFSTPSFHGVGVSLYYYGSDAQKEKGSDQRFWCIKCDHCNQWNEGLDWHENIRDLNEGNIKFSDYFPNTIVICKFCGKGMDRLSTNAEWVAKIPSLSKYCHGYQVSKLFTPIADLNQMMLDSKDPIKEQEFYNSDLGLPYEPKGSKLTDANIDACRGNYTYWNRNNDKKIRTLAGTDIGNKIHTIIGIIDNDTGKPKVLTAVESDDWEELNLIYNDFNVKNAVIDANPDKDEAIHFQKEHEGIWLSYYPQHLENTTETSKFDYDSNIVQIHRTLMMMIASDTIVNKNIILPINIRIIRDFYDHLKSPIKALKQNTQGNYIPFYPKTKNPDHFYHALVYFLTATQTRKQIGRFSIRNVLN
jgi:hypothetical protein